ncbi:MAG: 50S ribosomal protein L6 [Patescibacteria group bacterium]
MSRVGGRTLPIPAGVTVTLDDRLATIKGPKGELLVALHPNVRAKQESDSLSVDIVNTSKLSRSLRGLTVRLLENALQGVSEPFVKQLEIKGVGYKAAKQGTSLVLNVGYSHPVTIEPPQGVEVEVQKSTIIVTGIDKQLVGQIAANIRRVRPPEPYKGKGIRYVGEYVRKKAGKAAKAAGA